MKDKGPPLLEVVIEIPAWSFRKTRLESGPHVGGLGPGAAPAQLEQQFWSLLPCPFNYGALVDPSARLPGGVRSEEGDPADVIVLGPRLRPGTRVRVRPRLVVAFLDAGLRDDKLVARLDGELPGRFDRLVLAVFFATYTAFKQLRAWLGRGPRGRTRVLGTYSLD